MVDYFSETGCVVLVDKPKNWTSFDVVNKIRYSGKFKKVGHAGTLDPLATGLLVICIGKMTKQIDTFQAQEKVYTGTLLLGKTTPSIDLETDFDADFSVEHITLEMIEEVRKSFLGLIKQIPPAHSAIKVNGKRAYESARKGLDLVLKEREVEVKAFELDTSDFPNIQFYVQCSKGTYIRSLVRDFGIKLKSGACMTSLRRTKIGEFDVLHAKEIGDLAIEISKLRESIL